MRFCTWTDLGFDRRVRDDLLPRPERYDGSDVDLAEPRLSSRSDERVEVDEPRHAVAASKRMRERRTPPRRTRTHHRDDGPLVREPDRP